MESYDLQSLFYYVCNSAIKTGNSLSNRERGIILRIILQNLTNKHAPIVYHVGDTRYKDNVILEPIRYKDSQTFFIVSLHKHNVWNYMNVDKKIPHQDNLIYFSLYEAFAALTSNIKGRKKQMRIIRRIHDEIMGIYHKIKEVFEELSNTYNVPNMQHYINFSQLFFENIAKRACIKLTNDTEISVSDKLDAKNSFRGGIVCSFETRSQSQEVVLAYGMNKEYIDKQNKCIRERLYKHNNITRLSILYLLGVGYTIENDVNNQINV